MESRTSSWVCGIRTRPQINFLAEKLRIPQIFSVTTKSARLPANAPPPHSRSKKVFPTCLNLSGLNEPVLNGGFCVAPGDSSATVHVSSRSIEFASFSNTRLLKSRLGTARTVLPRTPGAIALQPGVAQPKHRRLIGPREGRTLRIRRVKGLGLFSHSSRPLAGDRVICD